MNRKVNWYIIEENYPKFEFFSDSSEFNFNLDIYMCIFLSVEFNDE